MNVMVTGGGTIAPIDDVRHIANSSTGRFSAQITEVCLERGASVWHVLPPSAERPFERSAQFDLRGDFESEVARLKALRMQYRMYRDRLRLYPVPSGTVGEYSRVVHSVLTLRSIDVAFLAMAASDYEPERVAGKIPSGDDPITLTLRPAPKVIRSVRDWSPDVFLVGFKLLSGADEAELIRQAEAACLANRADVTLANDYQSVREGRHRIHLIRPGQPVETCGPDDRLAECLVDRIFELARERISMRDPIELDPSE